MPRQYFFREKSELKTKDDIQNLKNELGWYKIFVSHEKFELLLKEMKVGKNSYDLKNVENVDSLYCVYVGKSSKLKKRLNAHFGNSRENTTLKTSLTAVLTKKDEPIEEQQRKVSDFMADAYFECGYKTDFKDGEYLCVWEAKEINKYIRILNIDCNENKEAQSFVKSLTKLRNHRR